MKILMNTGVWLIAIIPTTGRLRICKVNGAMFEIASDHRLYAACVVERQPGTIAMLYQTLCEEYNVQL